MSERVRRVNELMRQILSEALAEMTDPGLGFVTITSVDTTRDFEHATVYVSVLGNELKRERSLRALERAKARLQARVGREVTLRRTPRLRFVYDETFDKGRRIEQLLAEHEPMPDPVPEEPEGEPGEVPTRKRRDAAARWSRCCATEDPVCICAHASPDGDALGSLLGLGLSLAATGRDVVLYQDGDEPFPRELAFLQLEGIERRVPADAATRTLIALDCGSALRIDRRGEVAGQFARVVNIDHHHDNTLFGTINLVDPEASCTAEIVAGLLDEAGIPLADGAPLALYVGLVTDTGRFQYVNTTPRAHRLAARLLEEGVQPAQVFSTLFESLPLERQRLLGLALGRAEVAAGGRLAVTSLARDDFEATGADDAASDGVVDALRAIDGVELAALVREPRDRTGPARKVSLRSRAGGIDCSAIARLRGGGGHPGAAGYSTDETVAEIVAFLEEAVGT